MAICQIMIADFMFGYGNTDGVSPDPLYNEEDLKEGIAYCEWQLKLGERRCPLHNYNLKKFIKWAKEKINK